MQDDENVKDPDNIIEIPEDAFTSKESREKAGFTSSLGAQKPPKSRNRAVVCLIAAASVVSLMCGYILFDSKDLLQNRDFIQSRMAIKNNKSLQELSSPKPKKIAHYASLIKQLDKNKPVDKDAAEKVLQTFLENPALGPNAAAVIADANGKIIAAKNEDLALQPASTMKTLTALAASHILDMVSTLDTLVYASCDDSGSAARLVLRGGGDMLLGAGQNDPNHVNGRAGLETLANKTAAALKKRGVKIVQFAVDDSLFGAKRYPELINENDEEGRFYAPTSSVAVDEGRNRDFAAWVSYGNDADDTDDYPLLDRHPAVSTGLIFANLLQKSGIDVREWKGDSAKITKAAKVSGADSMHVSYKKPLISADFSQIARVCSAPLSEIMAYMLRHSDNSLAEEFGRLTALAMRKSNSPKGATLAVQDVLRNLGIDINGLHMSDCSGLSPKSAVRAITITVQLLQSLALTWDRLFGVTSKRLQTLLW